MDTALVLDLADQVLAGSTRTMFRSLLHDLSAATFPLQVCGRALIAGEAICCAGDSIELKPLAFAWASTKLTQSLTRLWSLCRSLRHDRYLFAQVHS